MLRIAVPWLLALLFLGAMPLYALEYQDVYPLARFYACFPETNPEEEIMNSLGDITKISSRVLVDASKPETVARFCFENLREAAFHVKYDEDNWPWELSRYPALRTRVQSLNSQFRVFRSAFKGSPLRDLESAQKFLSTPGATLPTLPNPQTLNLRYEEMLNSRRHLAQPRLVQYGLCWQETILHVGSCSSALEEITEFARPYVSDKTGNLTPLPLIKKVLNDQQYVEGARLAASRILQKTIQGGTISGNLFQDIYDSYLATGSSAEKAEERTWDLLAIYSGRGANITSLSSLATNENFPLLAALGVIGSCANILDSLTYQAGHAYSYPPTVTTYCDYGKPYHFWMSAYLARMVAKRTNEPVGAMHAAYLAEIGYQMLSDTFGRDPVKAFTEDTFSLWNNRLRIDLAFGAAGAAFGANSAQPGDNRPLNVDEALEAIISDSKVVASLSEDKAKELLGPKAGLETFRRWSAIFAPDAAWTAFSNPGISRARSLEAKSDAFIPSDYVSVLRQSAHEAIPKLEQMFKRSKEPEVRRKILDDALSRFGSSAWPLILSAIDDPSDTVTQYIQGHALGLARGYPTIMEQGFVPAIAKQLTSDNVRNRLLAVKMAKNLGEMGLSILAKAMDDASLEVRKAIITNLADTWKEKAIPILGKAAKDPQKEIRFAAITDAERILGASARGGNALPLFEILLSNKDPELAASRVHTIAIARGVLKETATPLLMKALDDPDARVRNFAVSGIYNDNKAGALSIIEKAIHDPDKFVRQSAIYAAAQIGGEDALRVLEKDSSESDSEVRKDLAYYAVEKFGEKAIPLLKKLLDSPDPKARLDALRKIRGKFGEKALVFYETTITDPNKDVRKEAIYGLTDYGGEKTLTILQKDLHESDPETLNFLLYYLRNKFKEKSIPIVLKLLDNPDPKIRGAAFSGLGRDLHEKAMPAFEKAILDPEKDVRSQVISSATELGKEKGFQILEKDIRESDPSLRNTLFYTIATEHKEKAIPFFMRVLDGPDPKARYDAIDRAGYSFKEASLPVLEKGIRDNDPNVRQHAITQAMSYAGEKGLQVLEKASDESDPKLLGSLIYNALNKFKEQSIPLLVKVLYRKDPNILDTQKDLASRAVIHLGQKALSLVDKALNHPDVRVRRSALEGLAYHLKEAAMPMLARALKDSDMEVRNEALKQIDYYTGEAGISLLEKDPNDSDSRLYAYKIKLIMRQQRKERAAAFLEKTFTQADLSIKKILIEQYAEAGCDFAPEFKKKVNSLANANSSIAALREEYSHCFDR